MKFFLFIVTLFLLFPFKGESKPKPAPPSRDGAVSLFKERHFNEALSQLDDLLKQNPEDDDLRYLLASTLAQLKKVPDTLETLKPLVMKDPSYYLYKVDFDSDFDLVRNLESFVKGLSLFQPVYLSIDNYSKDRMAQTGEGLILYHNGLKIPLHRSSGEVDYSAGFIDRDQLYYSFRQTDKVDKIDKKDKNSFKSKTGKTDVDLLIYSRSKRTESVFSQTEYPALDPISLIFPVASPLKSQ